MLYLNKVLLVGNLTRDVDSKALPSGQTVASFSIAVNRTWRDKAGAKQEATEYVNVVSFGKQAETIQQWFKKGDQIYVEGRLQTRSWDDKNNNKRYVTEVVMENFQFGNKKTKDTPVEKVEKTADVTADEVMNLETDEADSNINPEDIPF